MAFDPARDAENFISSANSLLDAVNESNQWMKSENA